MPARVGVDEGATCSGPRQTLPAKPGAASCTAPPQFVFVTECRGEPPHALRFCGWFEDELVKINDCWVFARRTLRQWGGDVLHRFPRPALAGPLRSPHLRLVERR